VLIIELLSPQLGLRISFFSAFQSLRLSISNPIKKSAVSARAIGQVPTKNGTKNCAGTIKKAASAANNPYSRLKA